MKSLPKSFTWTLVSLLALAPAAGALAALQQHTPDTLKPGLSALNLAEAEGRSPGVNALSQADSSSTDSAAVAQAGEPQRQAEASSDVASLNCDNPQVQLEMNRCAELDYQEADDALNQAYGELIATLNGDRKSRLIAAEQAWITYRDRTCEFESSRYEGGSIEPLIFYSCMAELTQDQTLRLQNYAEGY